MIKSVSAAALATVVFSASAFAADLPSRKAPLLMPVVAPPVMSWSGFYLGVNAGASFNNSTAVRSTAFSLFNDVVPAFAGFAGAASANAVGSINNLGFIGGGQIGYNWQVARSFVIGAEADFQGVAGSRSTSNFFGAAADPAGAAVGAMATIGAFGKSLDYFGTVRGRVGYLVTPNLLAYATGGLAYGKTNLSASYFTVDRAGVYGPGFGAVSLSDTRVGWTAGAGVEYLMSPNWSAKVEYLYYDLGQARTNGAVVAGARAGALGWAYAPATSTRFDGHVVRAGVNYHFNWGVAPVVARY